SKKTKERRDRVKEAPKDLLSGRWVSSRNDSFDLKGGQRAVDDQMDVLARIEIQRQRDEAEAFTGIVKAIRRNKKEAAEESNRYFEQMTDRMAEAAEKAREFDNGFRF